MCTGPTHAMSGLAAWAAVTSFAGSEALGQLTPKTWAVGATLATGAALLPDIDSPTSTVAETFGGISRGISSVLASFSGLAYKATSMKNDTDRKGTHRGFTHTLVFAALIGVITTAIAQSSSQIALGALMFFFAGLAVRGLMHNWTSGSNAAVVTAVSLVLTIACFYWAGDEPHNAAAFGVAVIIGCVSHFVGDAITEHGCPMLWPIPLGWQAWYPVAPPHMLRLSTGGKVEMGVLGPVLTVLAVGFSAMALYRVGAAPWIAELDLPPEVMRWVQEPL